MAAAGYVYFITDGDAVKIGFATDVRLRLGGLQSGNPRALAVETAFLTYPECERILHRHFKADRIAREWFRLTDDIVELWDDIFDYCGSRSSGETGKEFVANIGKVVVPPDDLRLILANLGKPWPALTQPFDPCWRSPLPTQRIDREPRS